MKVRNCLNVAARLCGADGDAMHPPQERRFLTALDLPFYPAAGGFLFQRIRFDRDWENDHVLFRVVKSEGSGRQYHAIAATMLNDEDVSIRMGIFVWRTNYLCCERCGPSLGEIERHTADLIAEHHESVTWEPYQPGYEYHKADLWAAIENAIRRGCPQLDLWCYGNEH